MPDEILQAKAEKFIQIYSTDVSDELVTELKDLKSIHVPNFGIQPLSPIELLNRIYKSKLQSLFSNCCIALRIFCTIPVSVAEAESSFSKLNLIKNFFTSMTQVRLSDLGILAIESELSRRENLDHNIDIFAHQKARKAHLI